MTGSGFSQRHSQARQPLPSCPFQIDFRSSVPAVLTDRTLACIQYGLKPAPSEDPRVIHVPLAVLDGPGPVEIWCGSSPVRVDISTGAHYSIRHADNGEILFGSLHIPEQPEASIERTAVRAYVHIHQLLERLGYPHWLRVWNYLSDITGGQGDAERYRQFTAGRYHALSLKPDFERQLPAATAVGSCAGGLTVGFLAGRHPPAQIENPRQMSAFHYPREYGPKSPSFSRATLQQWNDCSVLFVSGTASIVGHATLNDGDALGQFTETWANIQALLAHAARTQFPGQSPAGFRPESFKVYVRSTETLAAIAQRLGETLTPLAPAMVLEAELCRRNLLLEVEALYRWPADAGRG